jgi:hypothetical protein
VRGPFGRELRVFNIPAFLARDIPPEALPVVTRDANGDLRFTVGSAPFVYDRLGLRPEADAPPEEDPFDA